MCKLLQTSSRISRLALRKCRRGYLVLLWLASARYSLFLAARILSSRAFGRQDWARIFFNCLLELLDFFEVFGNLRQAVQDLHLLLASPNTFCFCGERLRLQPVEVALRPSQRLKYLHRVKTQQVCVLVKTLKPQQSTLHHLLLPLLYVHASLQRSFNLLNYFFVLKNVLIHC